MQASSTSSIGRFIDGGNRRRTSSSSTCSACSRGCFPAESSIPARHTLSRVLAAARTIPGKFLIGSSSPIATAGSASRNPSRSASGSTGRRSPPASRAANCPMVIICTPFSPARAAATRAMCPASFVWTTTVRRSTRAAFIVFPRGLSPCRPFNASGSLFQDGAKFAVSIASVQGHESPILVRGSFPTARRYSHRDQIHSERILSRATFCSFDNHSEMDPCSLAPDSLAHFWCLQFSGYDIDRF